MGGCGAIGLSDFSPLAGRKVRIWPDADVPGRTAAMSLAKLIEGSTVVDLPSTLSCGWDLADPIPEGVDVERLLAGMERKEYRFTDEEWREILAEKISARLVGALVRHGLTLEDEAVEIPPCSPYWAARAVPDPRVACTFLLERGIGEFLAEYSL